MFNSFICLVVFSCNSLRDFCVSSLSFLEAYFIVADRLMAQRTDVALDQRAFLTECVSVGKQYVLQGKLRNPECVSKELFGNALSLAANRNLLEPGTANLAERRQKFAAEMSAAVAAVVAIEKYDQQMRAAEKGPSS